MELATMLSLIEYDLQDFDACAASLRKALAVAANQGFIRLFLREGRPMARMLDKMVRRLSVKTLPKEIVTFLSTILAEFANDTSRSNDENSPGLISAKELEVLRESAKGSPNKVIARDLDISVPTVKFHLSNIYRKLGVGSRTMAVAVAREKNIL